MPTPRVLHQAVADRSQCTRRARSAFSQRSTASGIPERWKPRYANPAFIPRQGPTTSSGRQPKLLAITPDMLNEVVKVGHNNDPRSEEMVAKFLVDRRAAINQRYLRGFQPGRQSPDRCVRPDVPERCGGCGRCTGAEGVSGHLVEVRQRDRGIDRAREDLRGRFSCRDSADLPSDNSIILKAEISSTGGADPSWEKPVHAYFRHDGGQWKLVGFERMPEGNPPGAHAPPMKTAK